MFLEWERAKQPAKIHEGISISWNILEFEYLYIFISIINIEAWHVSFVNQNQKTNIYMQAPSTDKPV